MTRDEQLEALAKKRAAYGFSEFLSMKDSSRTVFIARHLEREFFFICRAEEVCRRDAKRMWALFNFIAKADNIGPDDISVGIIRQGMQEFQHLSKRRILQYLYKLEELHFTYKAQSHCKPYGSPPEDKEVQEAKDWEKRALIAERKLSLLYKAIVNSID